MEVYERFGIKKEEWDAQIAQFEHYRTNQDHYVALYNGKHLVFHQMQVVGAFETRIEAYDFAMENFEPGTFILQKCSSGNKDYTVRAPYRYRV